MSLHFSIQDLVAADGSRASLERTGLVIVVGANNAGKSLLLREISNWGAQYSEAPKTLQQVVARREPSDLDAVAAIEALEPIVKETGRAEPGNPTFQVRGFDSTFALSSLLQRWNSGAYLQEANHAFVQLVTAGSLGAIASQSAQGDDIARMSTPIALLVRNGETDRELSALCQDHFGFPLTLDRATGTFQYRVGKPSIPAPRFDDSSAEYYDAVSSLPLLANQGDGVKAFIGVAITVLANPATLLLIDEPEAFLHPPQSRALGTWLAQESLIRDKQTIVATHDRDFVLGALDAEHGAHIVRVSRDESGSTHLDELGASEVRQLWEDPVMRYSNVLQGIFHEQTVITESDADCRFYRAVLDSVSSARNGRPTPSGTLFIPSHGKDKVASMARSLSAVGVHPYSILDFDALRNTSLVKDVIDALGGAWNDEIDSSYRTIRDWANAEKNWDVLKKQGIGPMRGTVRKAAESLLEQLAQNRLLVVPVGEMEDLEPAVSQQKGQWVQEMLASKQYLTCQGAIELVSRLLDES